MQNIAKNLQLILMCIILVSTVIAVGIEIKKNVFKSICNFSRSFINVSILRSISNGKGLLGPTIN